MKMTMVACFLLLASSVVSAQTLSDVSDAVGSEVAVAVPYYTGFISGFEQAWILSTGVRLMNEGDARYKLFLKVCQYGVSKSIDILVMVIQASAESPDMRLRLWLTDFLTDSCLIKMADNERETMQP